MKHFGFGIVLAGLLVIGSSEAKAQPGSSINGFKAFLVESDAAQVELQSGKAEPYKSVWSHSDDVTISGGFGGTIEKGWANVSKRLDWAATQFSQGTNSIERLVAYSEGNIGYVVQLEHIKFKVPSTGADATRDFRVSMVFRREGGKWKIVHRHADGNMTKQPAQ